MKQTEKQHSNLLTLIYNLINIDLQTKERLEYKDIRSYIDKALSLTHIDCDEEDIAKLTYHIEYTYRITHTEGQCIFSDYEDRTNWYSNDSIKNPYFWSRYRQYLINNTSIDINSINLLDEVTLPNIMNCLGNPNDVFEGNRLRRGLIIGDVQSGKTATYSGLICKAADAGYKVVILLAGITESLRQQTQERIDEGIIGFTRKKVNKKDVNERVGVGVHSQELLACSFTSCANDFVGNCDKISTSLESHNSVVLFVIKKNVSVLKRLYNWLNEMNYDTVKRCVDQPMLLIDDEADNASVNTKKDETNPTRTNELIRKICNLFKNATYVGFTATPFANVFIDPDTDDKMLRADLFPEHFIYALPTPSNYIGATRIFYPDGDCYGSLRYINDIEEPDYSSDEYRDAVENDIDSLNSGTFYYLHKKEWRGILPNSLYDSILSFFIANCIRDLRGHSSAPRSMLVNMSRFTKVQRYIADEIEAFYKSVFDTIRYDFSDDDKHNEKLKLYGDLLRICNKHFSNIDDIPIKDLLKKQTLISAIEKIKVMVINGSKGSNKLDYKTNKSLRVIAVGGLALSRGLTLEGLIVSYFYRNTSTFDVLMQMGRWFGYRRGYEDLFQIWTSENSANWYTEIARASEELKGDIKHMFEQQLTPKDFGLKVRDNCDELQITASNKMRHSYGVDFQYSFSGDFYETPYISLNIKQNHSNWLAVNSFVKDLFAKGTKLRFADIGKYDDSLVSDKSIEAARFFENVSKEDISDFLSKIKCSLVNLYFNIPNIISYINDATSGLDNWDVVFVSGISKSHYDIPGLEAIQCPERAICENNKRVIQITSRRRLLSAGAGKLCLTPEQIDTAEKSQREFWVRGGCSSEEAARRSIPLKTYFKQLKDRKPILYILLISPKLAEEDPNKEEKAYVKRFREELGNDFIVAFGVGFPDTNDGNSICHYKVNKRYYDLNMLDSNSEEEEDEE